MKRFTVITVLLVLFVASAAFAAGSSHQITLNKQVTVNGTAVKAGDYKVKWEGTGDRVDLSLNQGKEVVATSPARIVAIDDTPGQDTFVYRDSPDGTASLVEIRFSGKKFALVLGEQTANASMNSSQSSNTTAK